MEDFDVMTPDQMQSRDAVLTDLVIRVLALERILVQKKVFDEQELAQAVDQVRNEIVSKIVEDQNIVTLR